MRQRHSEGCLEDLQSSASIRGWELSAYIATSLQEKSAARRTVISRARPGAICDGPVGEGQARAVQDRITRFGKRTFRPFSISAADSTLRSTASWLVWGSMHGDQLGIRGQSKALATPGDKLEQQSECLAPGRGCFGDTCMTHGQPLMMFASSTL